LSAFWLSFAAFRLGAINYGVMMMMMVMMMV